MKDRVSLKLSDKCAPHLFWLGSRVPDNVEEHTVLSYEAVLLHSDGLNYCIKYASVFEKKELLGEMKSILKNIIDSVSGNYGPWAASRIQPGHFLATSLALRVAED